jgi:hypothetical protein
MRSFWQFVVFGLTIALVGCGSSQLDPSTGDSPDANTRLGDSIDVSMAELLGKPRNELAALSADYSQRVVIQDQRYREGQLKAGLVATSHAQVTPILREARYSEAAGFSLPPYLPEGESDPDLALHLARFGDVDAGLKLLPRDDTETKERLLALRGKQNYPLEWTRLVAIRQQNAVLRLAGGDAEAATELVVIHRQLRELLDPKVMNAPLGSALLGGGRNALEQAAVAWKIAGRVALAEDVTEALNHWGDVPAPALAVPFGAARNDVSRLLRSPGQGRAIPAQSVTRSFDLLELPFPTDSCQGVIACFNVENTLAEVLVTYKRGIAVNYPEPRDLAQVLEDRGVPGQEGKVGGMLRKNYKMGPVGCEVYVVARSNFLGGLIRISDSRPPTVTPILARDFGVLSLDRSFEQNRVRLAPDRAGAVVQSGQAERLAQVVGPIRASSLILAEAQRAGEDDVTERIMLRCSPEVGESAPFQLALRLWAEGGPARISGVDDKNGGGLRFTWDDGRTRHILHLPYANDQGPEFIAEDLGSLPPEKRLSAVQATDRQERKARLAAGKPLERLPRYLDNEYLTLGLTRAEVMLALPQSMTVQKLNLPGGLLSVTFTGEPPQNVPYLVRQMFVRFDADGRTTELRARYADAGGGATWMQSLLGVLKKQGGAPAELPSPWSKLWADLPARKPAAVLYRWQDDRTLMTCQRDAWGVEVTLRDRGTDDEDLVALPPLEYLTRGPAGELSLGDSREDLMKAGGDKAHRLPDGALVIAPHGASPFDALYVWTENDRIVRITARHKTEAPAKAKAPQMAELLVTAWARDVRALGWPLRQDTVGDGSLQSVSWHDERTRVRLFWQESENGPARIFTEWKELMPVERPPDKSGDDVP